MSLRSLFFSTGVQNYWIILVKCTRNLYWNAIGLLSVWYYEGRGVYTCIHYYTCNTGAFSNGHWKGTYPNIDKQNKQTIWLFTKLRLSLDGREVKSSAHPFSSGKFKLVFNKQSKVINGKLSIGTQRKSRVSGPFCSTNCRSQSENVYRVYYLCFIPFFYQLLGGCKYKMYNILTTYTSLTIYFTCIGPKL